MKVYPTDESIEQVASVVTNPSMVAMNGPLFQATIGGLTAWKIGATELVLVALMSMFTVIRHTRAEEESGRLELVGAGVVGRFAPLTAALLVVAGTNLAAGTLTALWLIGTGLPATGSVTLGLAMVATGMIFAGLAAVAAQLTASTRSATAIVSSLLGLAYLLRALGDTGQTWMSWLSPIGWGMRMRAYAGEQWWPLALAAAVSTAGILAAFALNSRRDLGAGMLPQRPGPAGAAGSLSSPLGLAWRLQRGVFAGWLFAMAIWGAALGGVVDGISKAKVDDQVSELLTRMGGSSALIDAYLGAVFAITGVVVTAYTVQAMLRLRSEEASGRAEPLLATRVGRFHLATSHLVFAVLGPAVLLLAAGLGAGLVYGAQSHDIAGQVPRLIGTAMVQLPATWVLAGLGVALFGLVPRMTVLAWAALIACMVLQELGALFGFSQWVMDTSPYSHIPKLPGNPLTTTPLVWLTVIALALATAGYAGFRRRDIG